MSAQNNVICMATYRKKLRHNKTKCLASSSGHQVKVLIDSLKKMAELYQKQARTSP